MTTFYYLLSVVLIAQCSCYNVDIVRDEKDTTYGVSECIGFGKTTGSWSTCTCKAEYTTMMSKQNEGYDCFTPVDVGCSYSLTAAKQAYLITTGNISEKILPSVGGRSASIQRILVWNLHPAVKENGNWEDITNQKSANFSLSVDASGTLLHIAKLSTTVWGGLVIKVELRVNNSSTNCIIMKVKGTATYPVDTYKRLRVVAVVPTGATTEQVSKSGHPKTFFPTGHPQTYFPTVSEPGKSTIDRNEQDTALGKDCSGFGRTTQTGDGVIFRKCMCKSEFTTMMSRHGENYNCHTPAEVGCRYTLVEASKQVFVITQDSVHEELILSANEKCTAVSRVLVWNLHPEQYRRGKGLWADITNKTTAKFRLISDPHSSTSFLSISDLDTDAWIGLTVKIEVTGGGLCVGSCLIVKVQGQIQYPVGITKLLIKLAAPLPPTLAPVTSSGGHRHSDSNNSTGTTVGIIMAVLAIAVLAVAGVTYHRRRRAREQTNAREGDVGTERKPNTDLPAVNRGYEAEKCDKGSYSDAKISSGHSKIKFRDKEIGEKTNTSIEEEIEEPGHEGVVVNSSEDL